MYLKLDYSGPSDKEEGGGVLVTCHGKSNVKKNGSRKIKMPDLLSQEIIKSNYKYNMIFIFLSDVLCSSVITHEMCV